MNLFECNVVEANTIKFGSAKISTDTDLKSVKDKNLKLGIRSEYVQLMKSAGKNTVHANIESVDDWGNHKLISANFEGSSIKVKVKREIEVPAEKVFLKFPTKNCCIYENELLVS
jgi:glycerol transport system ATP-binding protein